MFDVTTQISPEPGKKTLESVVSRELDRHALLLQVGDTFAVKEEAEVLGASLYEGCSAFLFREYSLLGLALQKIAVLENRICHAIPVIIAIDTPEVAKRITAHLRNNHFFNKEPSSLEIISSPAALREEMAKREIKTYSSTAEPSPELKADLLPQAVYSNTPLELADDWRIEIGNIFVAQAQKEYLEGNPIYFERIRQGLKLFYPHLQPEQPAATSPQIIAAAIAEEAARQQAQLIVLEGERGVGKSTTAYWLARANQSTAKPAEIIHTDEFLLADQTDMLKQAYYNSTQTHYPPKIELLADLTCFQMALARALQHRPVIVEGVFSSELVLPCQDFQSIRKLEVLFELPYADHIFRAVARDFLCRHVAINHAHGLRKYDSVLKNHSYQQWLAAKRKDSGVIVNGSQLHFANRTEQFPASAIKEIDPVFSKIALAVKCRDSGLAVHHLTEASDLAQQLNYQLLGRQLQSLIDFFETKERALDLYTKGKLSFTDELYHLCECLGVPETVVEKYKKYLFHNRDFDGVAAEIEDIVTEHGIRVVLLEGKKGGGKSTLKTALMTHSEKYVESACDAFVNVEVHHSLSKTGMYDAPREADGYYVRNLYNYPALIEVANETLKDKSEAVVIIEGERVFPIADQLSVPPQAVLKVYLDTSFERNVAQVLFRDTLLRWPCRSAQETMVRLKKTCDARTADFFEHERAAADLVIDETRLIDRLTPSEKPITLCSGYSDRFFDRCALIGKELKPGIAVDPYKDVRADAFAMGFLVLREFLLPIQQKLITALRKTDLEDALHLYNSHLCRWGERQGADVSELQLPPTLPVLDLQALAKQISQMLHFLQRSSEKPVALYLLGNSGSGKTLLLNILQQKYGHLGISMERLAYLKWDKWMETIATKFMSCRDLDEFKQYLPPCLKTDVVNSDLSSFSGRSVILEGLFPFGPFELSPQEHKLISLQIDFSSRYSEKLRWFRQMLFRAEPFEIPYDQMAAVARLNGFLHKLAQTRDAVITEDGNITYQGDLASYEFPSSCPTIPFASTSCYDSAMQIVQRGKKQEIEKLNSEYNYLIPLVLQIVP